MEAINRRELIDFLNAEESKREEIKWEWTQFFKSIKQQQGNVVLKCVRAHLGIKGTSPVEPVPGNHQTLKEELRLLSLETK